MHMYMHMHMHMHMCMHMHMHMHMLTSHLLSYSLRSYLGGELLHGDGDGGVDVHDRRELR